MIMDHQQSKLNSKILENGIYIFILCGLLYVILFNQTTIKSFIFPSQQSQTQSHNTLNVSPLLLPVISYRNLNTRVHI